MLNENLNIIVQM